MAVDRQSRLVPPLETKPPSSLYPICGSDQSGLVDAPVEVSQSSVQVVYKKIGDAMDRHTRIEATLEPGAFLDTRDGMKFLERLSATHDDPHHPYLEDVKLDTFRATSTLLSSPPETPHDSAYNHRREATTAMSSSSSGSQASTDTIICGCTVSSAHSSAKTTADRWCTDRQYDSTPLSSPLDPTPTRAPRYSENGSSRFNRLAGEGPLAVHSVGDVTDIPYGLNSQTVSDCGMNAESKPHTDRLTSTQSRDDARIQREMQYCEELRRAGLGSDAVSRTVRVPPSVKQRSTAASVPSVHAHQGPRGPTQPAPVEARRNPDAKDYLKYIQAALVSEKYAPQQNVSEESTPLASTRSAPLVQVRIADTESSSVFEHTRTLRGRLAGSKDLLRDTKASSLSALMNPDPASSRSSSVSTAVQQTKVRPLSASVSNTIQKSRQAQIPSNTLDDDEYDDDVDEGGCLLNIKIATKKVKVLVMQQTPQLSQPKVSSAELRIRAEFKAKVREAAEFDAKFASIKPAVTKAAKFDSLVRKLQAKELLGIPSTSARDVHIFVDMSNMFIGFQDVSKIVRGYQRSARVKFVPFSFEHLAYILERGRNIRARKLAGSIRFLSQINNLPTHFTEAKAYGYDTNVLHQVEKLDASPGGRLMARGGPNYHSASGTSGDEGNSSSGSPRTKLGEQGVDENLHLSMLETILDAEPGIMVLATGDAKPAEFSRGFAHYATKALKLGWHLEIVSWRQCLSSEWEKVSNKFASQVRTIILDDFFDEILADWAE
ncbi:hypothetical protein JX265_009147 [Neoarthrinium moseri]|uniref:NYN domain-containing protein n=1 Tax=Neoarthrinium moseri TaxID=1658444 RepID=A0A9P9WGE4_9PEZI|nr:hypothetical protein JX265_009147 [Neoarthrinium moseri]